MSRRCLLTCLVGLLLATTPSLAGTMADMLGRPVTVSGGPMRVVSLAPSLTEVVFALGRGDWLVGVTDFCDYPPEARSKPKIGGPMTPNLERIVQLRPELVLATADGNPRDAVAQLARLHIPVFGVKPEGFAGMLASVEAVGRALQAETAVALLDREIRDRVAATSRTVAGRPHSRVLYLVWTDPLIAAGPASYIHDLIRMAGGENVVQDRSVPYPRLSWEEVVKTAPEVILVATDHDRVDAPSIGKGWKDWQSVPAIRGGRIIAVPGETVNRPGPRVVEGLERLARAIHPEAFARLEKR
jgi:iron complex transport system substrate-binding protein